MRIGPTIILTLAVLVGATHLVAWGIRAARADEPAPIDCEAWYEHFTAVTGEIPAFGDARARASEEQRVEARRRYVADCEKVIDDPETFAEDLHILRCTVAAGNADEWTRCVDPKPPRPPESRSRAKDRLWAIQTAERAYQAEWDVYFPCGPTPEEIPGAEPAPFEGGGLEQFLTLGWIPDGPVLCRYSVELTEGGVLGDFVARAECDEDGDGEIAVWQSSSATPPERITPEEVR